MKITSKIQNSYNTHRVTVSTAGNEKQISIPYKQSGYGSGVTGGEMLLLSIATCYCNDIYREAAKRNIRVNNLEIEVSAGFDIEGEPLNNIEYKVKLDAEAGDDEIRDLLIHTDKVSEVHNTIRAGTDVKLII